MGCKIFKPSNIIGGPFLGQTHIPFDDGSKIGQILLGEKLRNICFQTTSPKLDGGKTYGDKLSFQQWGRQDREN